MTDRDPSGRAPIDRRRWEPPDIKQLPPAGADLSLAQAAELYVWDRYTRGQINDSSAWVFASRLDLLCTALGPTFRLSQLDRAAILAWQRTHGGQSATTRRQYLSTVKGFCRWAVDEGYLAENPTAKMEMIREPRSTPRALTAQAVEDLVAWCDQPGRELELTVVWLMIGCGLRCVEVARLRPHDWDRAECELLVRGKGGHERTVPVPPAANDQLERYVRLQPPNPHGWLIRLPSESLTRAQRVSEMIANAMTAAGVHLPGDRRTAHSLRHTFATDVLAASGDLQALQLVMGHANIATTNRYLGPADKQRLRRAVESRWPSADLMAETVTWCPGCGPVDVMAGDVLLAKSLDGPVMAATVCPLCREMIQRQVEPEIAAALRAGGAGILRQAELVP